MGVGVIMVIFSNGCEGYHGYIFKCVWGLSWLYFRMGVGVIMVIFYNIVIYFKYLNVITILIG